MKRCVLLTGGGTAGHVTPNMALIPHLQDAGLDIVYVGSYDGIEKKLIEEMGIPYYPIQSGKMRRYFDIKNFTDPFRVIQGWGQALKLIKKLKPTVIFSKGGFVSVPVVMAGKMAGVPCVIHESDMTPGLANKLAVPFARKVCTNFEETLQYLPEKKAVYTGTPIRESLLKGSRFEGFRITGFPEDKPVILIMGGSMGAGAVNEIVWQAAPELVREYSVIHLCGKGKRNESLADLGGYLQMEYADTELPHLYAIADVMVSRAGANALAEILALRVPNILVPLPLSASRGDQILNARSFEKKGYSYVLEQEGMTAPRLREAIDSVYQNRGAYKSAMSATHVKSGIEEVMKIILHYAGTES